MKRFICLALVLLTACGKVEAPTPAAPEMTYDVPQAVTTGASSNADYGIELFETTYLGKAGLAVTTMNDMRGTYNDRYALQLENYELHGDCIVRIGNTEYALSDFAKMVNSTETLIQELSINEEVSAENIKVYTDNKSYIAAQYMENDYYKVSGLAIIDDRIISVHTSSPTEFLMEPLYNVHITDPNQDENKINIEYVVRLYTQDIVVSAPMVDPKDYDVYKSGPKLLRAVNGSSYIEVYRYDIGTEVPTPEDLAARLRWDEATYSTNKTNTDYIIRKTGSQQIYRFRVVEATDYVYIVTALGNERQVRFLDTIRLATDVDFSLRRSVDEYMEETDEEGLIMNHVAFQEINLRIPNGYTVKSNYAQASLTFNEFDKFTLTPTFEALNLAKAKSLVEGITDGQQQGEYFVCTNSSKDVFYFRLMPVNNRNYILYGTGDKSNKVVIQALLNESKVVKQQRIDFDKFVFYTDKLHDMEKGETNLSLSFQDGSTLTVNEIKEKPKKEDLEHLYYVDSNVYAYSPWGMVKYQDKFEFKTNGEQATLALFSMEGAK